jgi:hypothetical protein
VHRLLVLLLAPALVVFACSDEGKCPSGSECTQVDCSCTDVKCDLYPEPNLSIKISYDNGVNNTAKLNISLQGINQVEGHIYSGSEMLTNNTVTLYRSGGETDWPAFTDQSRCEIDTYEGADGQAKGSCTFIFHYAGTGDFNVYMPFNCTLNPV